MLYVLVCIVTLSLYAHIPLSLSCLDIIIAHLYYVNIVTSTVTLCHSLFTLSLLVSPCHSWFHLVIAVSYCHYLCGCICHYECFHTASDNLVKFADTLYAILVIHILLLNCYLMFLKDTQTPYHPCNYVNRYPVNSVTMSTCTMSSLSLCQQSPCQLSPCQQVPVIFFNYLNR